jgi:CRP-like cAMP-binding protein
MDQLINYIEKLVKLNDKAIKALYELADEEFFKKNQYILRQDERCDRIWFIKKGMVRKFHLRDGKEITTWIHTENDTFTSLTSYAGEVGADEFIQACEDTTTISITKNNSKKLAGIEAFSEFSNKMMAREFAKIDFHTKILNSKDARGRYNYLGEIAPEMIKRAKLGHIASIIGVSQETLSRIRKI